MKFDFTYSCVYIVDKNKNVFVNGPKKLETTTLNPIKI